MTDTFERIVANLEAQERVLRGGWRRAVVGAVVATAVVAAFGQLVGLLLALGHAVPGLDLAQGARFGWAIFYAVHHVGMMFDTQVLRLPGRTGEVLGFPMGLPVIMTVSIGLVGMTVGAMWILYRVGAGIADQVGGKAFRRGLHGAKVAIPYAAIAGIASWPLRFGLHLPETSPFTVQPAHVDAVLRPFVIAAVAGFAGGVLSGPEAVWESDWWETRVWRDRWRGAAAGGATTLLVALGLAAVGLCAMAIVRSGDAASYFHAVFAAGPLSGIALLLLSIALLPNAAAWVLQPAMGGCIQVTGGGGVDSSLPPYCFVSYSNFLTHRVGPAQPPWWFPTIGPAPRGYLVFLVVPAVAVILGTRRAVRTADARSARSGAIAGAMAGAAFTALYTALLALATVTVLLEGSVASVPGFYRYGPYPAYGFGLALAWGVVGGAVIGGVLGRLRRSGV